MRGVRLVKESWFKPKDDSGKDELECSGVGVVKNSSVEKKVVVGGTEPKSCEEDDW